MKKNLVTIIITLLVCLQSFAQREYILTRDGNSIINRRQFVTACLKMLKKDKSDENAITICDCRADKMDGHFTGKQYRQHTSKGSIDITGMIKEDSAFAKELDSCFSSTGRQTLLVAESFKTEYIAKCRENIFKSTEKKLDTARVDNFCNCQLELVKSKRIGDEQFGTIANTNSLLFYEMMYKCGNPFSLETITQRNWNKNLAADVSGPLFDTVKILAFSGMTYVKIKTGSMVQFWLFDTGASDLLINTEMETTLREEKIITDDNYLGTEAYEMANGSVDSCKRYRINNIRIGNYTVNNVDVAASTKGKKVIVGKSLMNKFSNWIINNKDNILILTR